MDGRNGGGCVMVPSKAVGPEATPRLTPDSLTSKKETE